MRYLSRLYKPYQKNFTTYSNTITLYNYYITKNTTNSKSSLIIILTHFPQYAIGRKIKSKEVREHWLDYADDKYERNVIEDIKSTVKVLKLFIPLPIFWALFDQQGSRWTFQATRMDGEVFGYLIKPDQFQVVNPLFIVIFIPIFQWVIYPFIERFLFINTPLRKLTVGGLLAALSFVISGLVEFKLEVSILSISFFLE